MRGFAPAPHKPFLERKGLIPKNFLANYFCLDLFTMVTTKTISITPVGPSPTGIFDKKRAGGNHNLPKAIITHSSLAERT